MPADPQIRVRISAKADELSASLAQVRKDLAGLPALAEQVNRKIGSSKGSGGFPGLEMQMSRFSGGVRGGIGGALGAFGSATRTIPGLGGLAGAASIAGVGEMMSRFASGGVESQNTSRLAGTTTAGLNSMRGAARLVGLSAGDADQAMLGLQHTLADAAFGRNSTAAVAFKQMGIDFGNMSDGARSAEQVLPKVVNEITRLNKVSPLSAERLANIWGIPSSALPMLIHGSEALAAQRREIERAYGSMDKYEAASSSFTASTARLSMASERLGMTITSAVEPHLTPLLERLSHFVDAHNQDIGQAFDRMGAALAKTDWRAVGHGIEGVGTALTFATRNADLLTTGLEAMAGTTIIRAILGNTPLGRFVTGAFLAYEAGGALLRKIDPEQKRFGTEQQQTERYGEQYRRVTPPGADNRSWWQRNMPSWLGGEGPSNDLSVPRGIRNNNPTNLSYVPGQQGVIGSDGRFGRYGDMRDGVGAALHQLLLYQERGKTSVASMINTWAPPSENDTRGYVRKVSAAMGVDPEAPVNLHDPETATRMIGAMTQVENGRDISPRLIRQGVNRVLGRDDDDGLPAFPGAAPPAIIY